MRLNKLFYAFVLTLCNVILIFGETPPMPPPVDPGGGTGGTGTGTAAAPIDNYVYFLAFTAILFIVLYAKKRQKKQVL